jgi:hypothetical protein
MSRKLLVGLFALVLSAATPGAAAAQETGTPVFKSPYRTFTSSEYGATFSDPGIADWALEGFYGYGRDRWDIGLRAGLVDAGDETGFVVGASARTRVLQSSETFALTLGIGGRFSDDFTSFFIPIGVSLGRRVMLEGSETSFVPYLHPVVVPVLGDDVGDDDVLLALGLGVDIKFSRSFDIRVAGAIGDDLYEGVSVGIAFIR